ncbi:MAG: DUF2971 domain-containing protein [Thermodesulfobacteriota bacterium]
MRLYHFLSDKYGEEALRKRRLKVSIINQLNDPFEFQAGFLNPTCQLRDTFRKFKDVISAEFGILCFSKQWSNPLLWSHYSEKHTGIALGFDVSKEALQVNYSKNRPLFTWHKIPNDSKLTQSYFKKLIKTKFLSWEHEEEFRLFYDLNELDRENRLYFQPFDDNLILKEVIAGCKTELSDNDFLGLLEGYNSVTAIKSEDILFLVEN